MVNELCVAFRYSNCSILIDDDMDLHELCSFPHFLTKLEEQTCFVCAELSNYHFMTVLTHYSQRTSVLSGLQTGHSYKVVLLVVNSHISN